MTTALSLPVSRAARWLVESGIQEASGGVARYHRTDLRRNARISTEITGYGAGVLMYLHGVTGESDYFHSAVRAGRFLTRSAWDPALRVFPFEVPIDSNCPEAAAYFFDCGIIARGLLSVWRASGEAEFLEAARQCASSMASDFAAGDGYHPVLSLPSKVPAPYEPRWSRAPGCYQLKAAMAWFELADATGDREWGRLYESAVGASLGSHEAFLPGEERREKVMDRLHAYCYFLEGLLPCARHPQSRTVLADGIERVAHHLREIAPAFERSDVYAQLLRLRLYADRMCVLPLDRRAAREETRAIERFQAARGGFWFGRNSEGILPYMNPVSTAFCLQALHMGAEYRQGRFEPDVRLLI